MLFTILHVLLMCEQDKFDANPYLFPSYLVLLVNKSALWILFCAEAQPSVRDTIMQLAPDPSSFVNKTIEGNKDAIVVTFLLGSRGKSEVLTEVLTNN